MQNSDEVVTVEELFGKGVKALRTKRNWSQQALAERLSEAGLNIDTSGVSRIEKGTRALRLSEALLVAEALDIDLDWLLRPAPTQDAVQRLEEATADVRRDYRDLVDGVERLALSREWLAASLVPHEGDPSTSAVNAARRAGQDALEHHTFAEAVREGSLQFAKNGPSDSEALQIVAEAGGVRAYVEGLTGLDTDS